MLSHSRLHGQMNVQSSQDLINVEVQLGNIMSIVDQFKDDPEEMKQRLAVEFKNQNDNSLQLIERLRQLETIKAMPSNAQIQRHNQDLTLSVSRRDSADMNNTSNVPSFRDETAFNQTQPTLGNDLISTNLASQN